MENLKKICDGVYHSNQNNRPFVMHDGRELQRFMDIFYIDRPTDELTPAQVEALCRARADTPSSFAGGANAVVRESFRKFIRELPPANLLEIGAGTNPLLSDLESGNLEINYVRSDADPINTETRNIFSGTNNILEYEDGFFDVAIAVFVLHFKFYESQIAELSRCLATSGIFVANIYRRTPNSRVKLLADFHRNGFACQMLNDPHQICQNHQYLVAAKNQTLLESASDRLGRILATGQA